jgi:hypothetical protein
VPDSGVHKASSNFKYLAIIEKSGKGNRCKCLSRSGKSFSTLWQESTHSQAEKPSKQYAVGSKQEPETRASELQRSEPQEQEPQSYRGRSLRNKSLRTTEVGASELQSLSRKGSGFRSMEPSIFPTELHFSDNLSKSATPR